jgi:hypothetical protein
MFIVSKSLSISLFSPLLLGFCSLPRLENEPTGGRRDEKEREREREMEEARGAPKSCAFQSVFFLDYTRMFPLLKERYETGQ